MKIDTKQIGDVLKRYWYWAALLGALLMLWAAPALISTAITFVVAVALVVVVAGLVLHVLTPIKWTDWTGDSDIVKAAKAITIGIVFAGLCLLGSAMWQQEHQTANAQKFNADLQTADSTIHVLRDSLEALRAK